MPRSKPAAPPLLDDRAVFTLVAAGEFLGLPRTCLKREAREGRLRVSRRAGKYWTCGSWLWQWLLAGERARRPECNGDA
jgi:hypothetical protein